MESKTFSHHHNHHVVHVKWYMLCKACHVIHVMWYMLCDACFVIHVMTPTIDMPSVRRWCEGWERHIIHAGRWMRLRHGVCDYHHHHRQYCTYNVRTFTRSLMCHDNNDQMKEILFFRNACIYETYDKVTVVSLLLSDMFLQRLWRINLASLLDTGSHVKWLLMWKTWKRLYIKQNPLEWGVNTCVTASWISYA